MATLTYSSVADWVRFALWCERNKPTELTLDTLLAFLKKIEAHTREEGWTLRQGYRLFMLPDVLADVFHVAPYGDGGFSTLWYQIKQEDWLPDTSKPKPDYYYVIVKKAKDSEWSYLHKGDRLGDRIFRVGYPEKHILLSWNNAWGAGDQLDGALYRSHSRSDAQNVKELALCAPSLYSDVKITTKPPEEERHA